MFRPTISLALIGACAATTLANGPEIGHATCRYHLRNLSDRDRDLSLAFFITTLDHGIEQPRFASRLGFRVLQDGRELPMTVEPLDSARWAHLVRAPSQPLGGGHRTRGDRGPPRLALTLADHWADFQTGLPEPGRVFSGGVGWSL
jgi:hypothetical protein